ncbi:MAG: hypothetical protein ABJD07_02650 [Gemmatimonadaceae bacterium]
MRATLIFAVVVLAIAAALGAILAVPFATPDDRRAIVVSGAVAVVVQVVAFAIARRAFRAAALSGWLIGAAIRFVTLLVYGLVVLKPLLLPAPAALISLVLIFFVSTLIEPKMLTL